MSVQEALKDFINSSDCEDSIISATKASWCGGDSSKFFVEIFPDGNYQVIYQPGNLYSSPGRLIGIPPLGEDEYDYEDGQIENPFFDNCRDYLLAVLEEIEKEDE